MYNINFRCIFYLSTEQIVIDTISDNLFILVCLILESSHCWSQDAGDIPTEKSNVGQSALVAAA